ncbi:hypothetical protein N0V90_003020 [Kalmusia sp. IMI 367209]|nr:hypothetical protein N0V90_003020 [Kalmusia sp. IMI 367209]
MDQGPNDKELFLGAAVPSTVGSFPVDDGGRLRNLPFNGYESMTRIDGTKTQYSSHHRSGDDYQETSGIRPISTKRKRATEAVGSASILQEMPEEPSKKTQGGMGEHKAMIADVLVSPSCASSATDELYDDRAAAPPWIANPPSDFLYSTNGLPGSLKKSTHTVLLGHDASQAIVIDDSPEPSTPTSRGSTVVSPRQEHMLDREKVLRKEELTRLANVESSLEEHRLSLACKLVAIFEQGSPQSADFDKMNHSLERLLGSAKFSFLLANCMSNTLDQDDQALSIWMAMTRACSEFYLGTDFIGKREAWADGIAALPKEKQLAAISSCTKLDLFMMQVRGVYAEARFLARRVAPVLLRLCGSPVYISLQVFLKGIEKFCHVLYMGGQSIRDGTARVASTGEANDEW